MPSSLNVGGLLHFIRIGKGTKQSDGRLTITSTGRLQLRATTKPATCTVGELISDSADGNKLYQCTATNTWTKVGTQV